MKLVSQATSFRGVRWRAVASVVVAGLALGGCQNSREIFGLDKKAPDEFAVLTRAPLSMPPDYGLRPPTPGVKRPQERAIRDEARRILLSSAPADIEPAAGGPRSTGETALLERAGTADADPTIRQKVSRENQVLAVGDNGLIDRLMFWRKEEPKGSAIDPTLEARRLSENAALGDAATKGPTPVIKRKKRGFLEGLF